MMLLEIVSDVVCPWCFIGLKRLDAALDLVRREAPGFQCQTRWRPFFLNPHTPPQGEPYLPFLEQKFGGAEAVRQLFARVREGGRPYGVEFAFEKIALRANTLAAHRLIHRTQQGGSARPLVEALFAAQFQQGAHMGDLAVLANIAAACGQDPVAVARYLASDEDEAEVLAQEAHFRRLGVNMVPTFIVNQREVVVGAEDPARLAAALLRGLTG